MSTSRGLVTLTTGAIGLFGIALLVSVGEIPTVRLPAVGLPALPMPEGGQWAFLAAGAGLGWLGRWLYGLPWGALPRAAGEWLLGWSQRVTLTLLGLAFIFVLLLY